VKRPPGRKRRSSAPPEPLSLAEWDFKNCSPAELSLCRGYEYARSSTLIRESVARLRAGGDDALSRAVRFVLPIQLGILLLKFHWWPLTAYLSIPTQARAKLISAFKRPEARKSTESLASLVDPFADDHLHISGAIIPIYVPPGQPLKILERAFADLLQRDYPDLFGQADRSEVTFDADLKCLSMWRLREQGYTAQEAIALAKVHKVAIYNNIRVYRRAVAKAEERIRKLEDLLRHLADHC
jgi:hypothetical protein